MRNPRSLSPPNLRLWDWAWHGRIRSLRADGLVEAELRTRECQPWGIRLGLWSVSGRRFTGRKKLRGASPRTLEDYRCLFRSLQRFQGRDLLLTELTDDWVESYLDWLAVGGPAKVATLRSRPPKPRAAATRNKHLTYVLAIWRAARKRKVRERLNGSAPIEDPEVDKERVPKRIPEAWTESDVDKLIAVAIREPGMIGPFQACDFWPAVFSTIYVTAWRIGALMKLPPSALEVFPSPLPCGAPACLRVRGETQKDRDDDCKLLDSSAYSRLLLLSPHEDRTRLFECPFTLKTLRKRFKRIMKAAGLSSSRWLFHKIRATHATMLESKGGDATESLGHSARSVTVNSYLDPRHLPKKSPIELLPPLARPTSLRVAAS